MWLNTKIKKLKKFKAKPMKGSYRNYLNKVIIVMLLTGKTIVGDWNLR